MSTLRDLARRVDRLERQLRRARRMAALALAGMVAGVIAAWTLPQDTILRVRGLIVEDEQGRDRIVIGAPVPNPREGQRSSPSVGMVINDPRGFERFGVGLKGNGSMSMGFDAPPGTGDDRNRERINLTADERGGSQIRLLDRETYAGARLYLNDDDRVLLDFPSFSGDSVFFRRIGFEGEELVAEEMR